MTPCGLVEGYYFRELAAFCVRVEYTSVKAPAKCWYLSTKPQGFTFHKTGIYTFQRHI